MDISSLRIGDVERDAALERLQSHYAAGRLSTGEFEERMEKALAAHYQSELDPLFTDLPDDPQTRFFDETGPVGRAARPSALTPWQAPPPAPRPSRRGTASAVLGTISGLVWPAALFAVLRGARGLVGAAGLAVSVAWGVWRGSRRRSDRRELPAADERRAALLGGPSGAPGPSAPPHEGREWERPRTVRQEARARRRELRDSLREQYRTQRREYRRRRRGR